MFRDGLVFDAKRLVNNVGVYILQKKRMSGFIISISLLLHYMQHLHMTYSEGAQ